MRINVIGGGPAGLYFALLMKKADARHEIAVLERNRPDDTFGWGVVFSDQTLDNFRRADPETYQGITGNFIHWDDIDIHYRGEVVTAGGQGFCGIARKKLLHILQERALGLGVRVLFQADVEDEARYLDADLVVAADGIHSRVRQKYADVFQPELQRRKCRYIWLGTRKPFDAFTFYFEETPHGWFTAHCYPFDADTSTFIVECPEETWKRAGLEGATTETSVAFCESLFGKYLDGHRLMSNAGHRRGSEWLNFMRVHNDCWRNGKVVLMGDAAHTAHFSIGSGTKLAMEDAIGLAQALETRGSLSEALTAYEAERRLEVVRLQNAARNSMEWFENVARYAHLEPLQFGYSLLTRSQRISHENLRLRDRDYVERIETWLGERSGGLEKPVPPMFTPFRLRNMVLSNRVVVSPMSMYSAQDGTPDDFHLVHLGARAQGGAALVVTEMTDVSRDGRISPGCAGMYKDEHVVAWKRIVDFVHRHTPAKVCLQLGHAGPKGSTQLGWQDMDEPLPEGNWPLIAASPVAYGPRNQVPKPMDRSDMDRVKADYVRAARMAEQCGFDMLELHCAHGYLLSSFITPLMNRRGDEYGGSLENRLRYPLEVFCAVRAAWPQHKPMSVRISATDWVEGGITGEDSVLIARLFRDAGADLIDVSAGQTSRLAKPVYGRMFQTPFADRIRNDLGIATMAVGNIFEPDHVNSIIAAGRADLCALARPHLADPYWTLRAAAQLGHRDLPWPAQYLTSKSQLERNLQRAAQVAAAS
ncbi:MAG: bifunctional salicylyl-CoA 5-hydroxylase/oxidoreductase [Betaproteobacteria bacterium]|nr:bifunctional salicylyl-CoA 5-hydroxylase/oxidoreductase [Betaproteobacteria bacterium]